MAQKNNHIWLSTDKTYYSVPYTVVGTRVDVIYTATLVSIYAGGKLIATHRRTNVPHTYCTTPSHMPPPHQAMQDREVQKYLQWATATNAEEIYTVVSRILHARRFVQQSYKSCDGIKSLCRTYGVATLQRACRIALELDCCTYGFLREYLQTHPHNDSTTPEQLPSLPKHDNIRGAACYQ